jgi:hypothetical protein
LARRTAVRSARCVVFAPERDVGACEVERE